MVKSLDVSFWNAHHMAVVIPSWLGYDTDTVPVRGGTRTYHYIRIGSLGIEVAITKADTA